MILLLLLMLLAVSCSLQILRNPIKHVLHTKKFLSLHGSASQKIVENVTPTATDQQDEIFMRLALRHAQHAFRDNEVPIGAVLVNDCDGTIVVAARNQVESDRDASAHAEMICMRKAAALRNNWRLLDCTLYTTLEPCMMCLGAMHAFRIKRVVYAASDSRVGACGSWLDLTSDSGNKHPIHSIEITGGVLAEDSSNMLRRFFKNRRDTSLASTKQLNHSITSESSVDYIHFNRGSDHS